MLILSEKQLNDRHYDAKKGLTDEFNKQLEKILNENQKFDRYWILGKVKFNSTNVGHVFLQACAEKPPLVKEAFLYEVDNRKGCKTLLWVMHPGDKLSLPTLGKTVQVHAGQKNRKRAKQPILGRR